MKKKKTGLRLPTFDQMLIPTLEALKRLDGSGSIGEINGKVYEILGIDEETLNIPHKEGELQNEVDYRMAWARTYLKKYGLIDNSSRGIWALVDNEIVPQKYKSGEIVRAVRMQTSRGPEGKVPRNNVPETVEEETVEPGWKEKLLEILRHIDPSAFERLSQRILRESGFIQVEVTGKSGDGGIDGKGIVRLNGLLSFHVFFQCKRFKDSVTSGDIRDFRGAMQGRSDKGIFLTTGKFTRDAIREASRDGAPPIDLIDGEMLCDKLKEFGLGVRTELIEEVTVVSEWFDKL